MSKRILNPYPDVDEIIATLERELRPPLRLIRHPRKEQKLLDLRVAPDLVVYDEETRQMTLIEIKVAPTDDDLPFATISEMCNLKDWNAMLNPRVVLVSLAEMSSTIERALVEHDIGVIRGRTCDDVMPALLDFIHAGSVVHR